jgi:hypothetical protein
VVLDVGPSEGVVRLFTNEATLDKTLGKLVSLHEAYPSH